MYVTGYYTTWIAYGDYTSSQTYEYSYYSY